MVMQLCFSLVIRNCIYIFVNNLYSSYLVLGGNLAHCPFLLCQLVWMLSCISPICCSTLTKQPQAVFKRSLHPQIIWRTHNTHCYSNYVVVFSSPRHFTVDAVLSCEWKKPVYQNGISKHFGNMSSVCITTSLQFTQQYFATFLYIYFTITFFFISISSDTETLRLLQMLGMFLY